MPILTIRRPIRTTTLQPIMSQRRKGKGEKGTFYPPFRTSRANILRICKLLVLKPLRFAVHHERVFRKRPIHTVNWNRKPLPGLILVSEIRTRCAESPIYVFKNSAFFYYFPDTQRPDHYTTNPRYFYNFATGQIVAD